MQRDQALAWDSCVFVFPLFHSAVFIRGVSRGRFAKVYLISVIIVNNDEVDGFIGVELDLALNQRKRF